MLVQYMTVHEVSVQEDTWQSTQFCWSRIWRSRKFIVIRFDKDLQQFKSQVSSLTNTTCQLDWSTTDTSQQFNIIVLYVTQFSRRISLLISPLESCSHTSGLEYGPFDLNCRRRFYRYLRCTVHTYSASYYVAVSVFDYVLPVMCKNMSTHLRVEMFIVEICQCQDFFKSWTYFHCIVYLGLNLTV